MSRHKLTSLAAIMPQKGEAMRPELVAGPSIKQETEQASEQTSRQEGEQTGLRANLHFSEQASLTTTSEYQDGPRSAVSFRMTERLQDRLREYAHRSRRRKQDVLDQAVHEFLLRAGF